MGLVLGPLWVLPQWPRHARSLTKWQPQCNLKPERGRGLGAAAAALSASQWAFHARARVLQ